MFVVGLMTLFEIKLMLPLPHFTMPKETTVVSTYVLGLFSGITSSCCAPVLFAAMTLSTLSPTFATSLIVSIVYVMGIVFPLFFLSLFYERITNQYLYNVKKKVEKPLKILAAGTFMVSAAVISILALTGRIQMDSNMEYAQSLRMFIYNLSSRIGSPVIDIGLLVGICVFVVFAIKQAKKKE